MLRPFEHGLPAQIRQPTINWNDVQYAGNMAGHIADYAMGRGDFAPIKRSNAELMEADSSTNKTARTSGDNNADSMDVGVARLSGSIGSNGGFRGRFVGNTQTNYGYEKHYNERQLAYSKKLFTVNYTWGLSVYDRRDRVSGQNLTKYKWGTTGAGGKAVPGVICFQSNSFWGTTSDFNAFTPFGKAHAGYDFTEAIYSNAFNLRLQDFLDNKLFSDSGAKGIFVQYNKFRIKSFTVHIKLESTAQNIAATNNNVLHSGRNNNGWQSELSDAQKYEFQKVRLSDNTDLLTKGYFIYRDIYNTYANSDNFINEVPTSSLADQLDVGAKREQFVIKNLDSNLTYVKNGEEFSFTREIKPQGSYYLDKAGILANLKTSIGSIVAQLEGQVAETSTIVKKLPEGFNFLIVPGECDIDIYGEVALGGASASSNYGNGYIVLPNLQTKMHVKCTAEWECFDYNYSATPISRLADPLEKALSDYNMSKQIELGQLNRAGSQKI